MNDKKILIISTCFSPKNVIGAVRLSKIVKYLVRLNYQIVVISPVLHESANIDSSFECDEFDQVERFTIAQSGVFDLLFKKRRNQLLRKKSASSYIQKKKNLSFLSELKLLLFRIIHFAYIILRNRDWEKQATKFITKKYKQNSFDFIFSSYPSLGAHWAAKNVKRKGIGRIWVADFRDPINYKKTTTRFSYHFYTKFQDKIVSSADHIVTISQGLLDKICHKNHDVCTILYNGFDPEDIKYIESAKNVKKNLVLSYTGSLYGGERDLRLIFRAIKELYLEKRIDLTNISIEYAGKDSNIFFDQLKHYDLQNQAVDHGFVTKQKSIEIQYNSDLIMVATWNTEEDQGILSGKLFECFLLRRNILSTVSGNRPNSEFANLIRSVNGGCVIEECSTNIQDEINAAKNFIEVKYNEKQLKGTTISNYSTEVDRYSYPQIVGLLDKLFLSLY